jgi:O-succinylhomoserine sulfhydrylase
VVHRQIHGGSTLVAFEVKGGKFRFQDALKLIRISNNLGDAASRARGTRHQRRLWSRILVTALKASRRASGE